MTRSALLLGLGVSAAVTQLPACTESCSCEQNVWLVVSVVDAVDGGLIPSAMVNGLPCPAPCALQHKPDGGPPSAGPVELALTADHYQPLSLTVIVPATEPVDYGCCGLGPPWIGTFVTVPLRPF